MAGRSNDVQLVIKAKNEAAKTLEQLSKALDDVTVSQEKTSKSADKTGTLVGQLGDEFAQLGKQLSGLAALGKIASEFDSASKSVARIDDQVKETATSFAELARQGQAASDKTNNLRARLDAETRTRDENNVSLREAKKELREVEAAIKRATTAQEKANAAIAKQVKPNPFSAENSASVFAGADLANSRAAQTQLNRDIATYEKALASARQTIKDLNPQIAAAARQQDILGTETEKAARSLRSQREDLASSRATLAGIRDISEQANARLGTLAGTQDKVAEASARMAAQMAAAKARIEALSGTAAKPTAAATPAANATPLAVDDSALASQRRLLLEARKEWVAAQDTVKRLAQEMRNADQPTEELGQAFGRAQAQARLAKQAYDQQAVSIQRLAGAAQGGFAAYASLETRLRTTAAATTELTNNSGGLTSFFGRLRASASQTADSMDGIARGTTNATGALRGLGGERQALSMMQRLRSEVLSLVAAYLGLHAAINQIGGVVKAFQTIEAAQSRLGVVFNQDTARVSKELSFLNSEAGRLGITFSVLADEYGKFAVAASSANFSAENTRKIFTSVAEAARVNKLSVDQMSGVFLALQQMISKGKVTSEELRRQLGDRLTGAFDLFAKALGLTTAELDEMMQKGEVLASQSNLLKFADELDRKFGPQLAASLVSVTAEIGRFQNELFNAQVRVGQGGFMEGLRIALIELNKWFSSREGRDFFLSIGQALGAFVEILAKVPQWFGVIAVAIKVFIALRLAAALRSISFEFGAAAATSTTFAARMVSLRTTVLATTTALSTLGGVLTGIRTLAAGTLALLGGIPGLITLGVVFALSSWMSGVNSATSALDEHQRQLDEINAGYLKAGSNVDAWAKNFKGVSLVQAKDDLDKMKSALEDLRARAGASIDTTAMAPKDLFGTNSSSTVAAVTAAVTAFREGTLAAADFKKEIDRIAQSDTKFSRDLALGLQTIADEAIKAEERAEKAGAKFRFVGQTATEADKALLGFKNAADAANRSMDDTAIKQYTDALKELKSYIPELANEMKRLQELSKLDTEWKKILEFGPPSPEDTKLYQRAIEGINLEAFSREVSGSFTQAAVGLLKTFEGFQASAKYDVNAFRAGYGSDTVTLSDGTIQKITEGMSVNQVDALRDLVRRIGEFSDVVKRQIGSERFNQFSKEQQAALTSIAYNYGSLPTRIIDAVKKGSASEIAAAVRGLKTDGPFDANGRPVNAKRRETEASILEQGSQGLTAQRNQAEADLNKHVTDRVTILKEEASAREDSTRELAIQKEIHKAEAEAEKLGLTVGKEQLEQLRQAAGAKWDAANAAKMEKEQREQAKVVINEVVGLDQQRTNLLRELTLAQKTGDTERIDSVKQQITDLNGKIIELLPNAMAMSKALGDERMVATLEKVGLNTDLVNEKVRTAASNVNFLGLNFSNMKQLGQGFVNGFVGALDKFAQAVAEGKNKVDALRDAFLQFAADFLRQVAQMILKQALLNALKAAFPASGGGFLAGVFNHTGGVVGRDGTNRRIPVSAFTGNVMRYHSGGIAGLKPNEVPTVLEKNEEVLTTDDPRHQFNGGAGGQRQGDTKIVNVFDAGSYLSEALNSRIGEKVILNHVRANSGAFKAALG